MQDRQQIAAKSVPGQAGFDWPRLIGASVLVLLVVLAYGNTLQAPLIFDDEPAITENESIRRWSTAFALQKDSGATCAGRPLLNASFALNYALSGHSLAGFHATNIIIHCLAALVLWGVVRRTLAQPVFAGRFPRHGAEGASWFVAALWALHPLQTESVTYTVQRAESLVGLFYLLTLYAFIRATDKGAWRGWFWLMGLTCLAGMASKEVMATAPLIVWLYDRTFVSGSFVAGLRRHGRWYAMLGSTWLLLAYLVMSNLGRGGSVGFSEKVNAWNYLCTQGYAVVKYLFVAVWPVSLTLDYGEWVVRDPWVWVPCCAAVVVGLATTGIALKKRPSAGFLAAWFFVILAPTSSVIPVLTQTVAEHRMYLPLAGITTAAALLIFRWGVRSGVVAGCVVLGVLSVLTWQRNAVYGSAVEIWADTLAKRPENPRAVFNYGLVLAKSGKDEEAIPYYEKAIEMKPSDAILPLSKLGATLLRLGRIDEAIRRYEEVLRIDSSLHSAHHNLGLALLEKRRVVEGLAHLRMAVSLKPDDRAQLQVFVRRLDAEGLVEEACTACADWVKLVPTADVWTYFGVLHARCGRLDRARDAFEEALRIEPQHAEASANLRKAQALLQKKSLR